MKDLHEEENGKKKGEEKAQKEEYQEEKIDKMNLTQKESNALNKYLTGLSFVASDQKKDSQPQKAVEKTQDDIEEDIDHQDDAPSLKDDYDDAW